MSDRGGPPAGPDALFGSLFETVQLRRLFGDGKTFPDMDPRQPPDAIMAAWEAEQPAGDEAIRAFVARHFVPPRNSGLAAEGRALPMRDHIRLLWETLSVEPATHTAYSSALTLPEPYVVPGGRFREIYYWDSYFTMLGLAVDGRGPAIERMLDNFVSLVERYGHVPNGARTYYLSRSQPPFLALMSRLSASGDPKERARRLAALRREHDYWMRGADALAGPGASEHVVRLPDGRLLNRYWDSADGPRPESYAEDVETAARSGRAAAEIWHDLRAACESGWDFSSRWLADGRSLETIQASAIVPVDLNALLYIAERQIADECAALGHGEDAARYAEAAERRAATVRELCWLETEGRFADWHWREGRAVDGVTAATLYPLFAGIATAAQAERVAETAERALLAPGGLRTTTTRSGQQWDAPNGWAPLQWIAIVGLRRYGHEALADRIAARWIETVEEGFAATGALLEKYDVEDRQPASGGEYLNQIGFGWTNGVTQALLHGADRLSAYWPGPASD